MFLQLWSVTRAPWVSLSWAQIHVDRLGWGSAARGVPAFHPVDGWGVVGVEIYFWVENGFM